MNGFIVKMNSVIVYKLCELQSSNHGDVEVRSFNCWDVTAKIGTFNQYHKKCWTDLHQILKIGRQLVRMINLAFFFRSPKGRCYGNQTRQD